MLMLIDTADPRPPPRDPRPGPRRPPSMRLRRWLAVLGGVACLLVARWVPPLVAYALFVGSLWLFTAAAVSLLPSGADGLRAHRQ
jgi:hypothetical protein